LEQGIYYGHRESTSGQRPKFIRYRPYPTTIPAKTQAANTVAAAASILDTTND